MPRQAPLADYAADPRRALHAHIPHPDREVGSWDHTLLLGSVAHALLT